MMYILLENCKQGLYRPMYFFIWIFTQKKIQAFPVVDPPKILVETGTGIILYIYLSLNINCNKIESLFYRQYFQ